MHQLPSDRQGSSTRPLSGARSPGTEDVYEHEAAARRRPSPASPTACGSNPARSSASMAHVASDQSRKTPPTRPQGRPRDVQPTTIIPPDPWPLVYDPPNCWITVAGISSSETTTRPPTVTQPTALKTWLLVYLPISPCR
jgi:hypothetical protein